MFCFFYNKDDEDQCGQLRRLETETMKITKLLVIILNIKCYNTI